MNINQLKTSNFLKRDDVGDGTIVTIRSISQQNVAKEGAPEEMKWCLHVDEFDKGMVLNSTNGQLIAHALKSEESEDWIGKQVILFDDPSVSFGGKLVGGIRVRALPKTASAPARTAQPSSAPQTSREKLKGMFRQHEEWDKKFKAEDVKRVITQKFSVGLNELTEQQAETAIMDFDKIMADLLDDPF